MQLKQKVFKCSLKASSWSQHSFCNASHILLPQEIPAHSAYRLRADYRNVVGKTWPLHLLELSQVEAGFLHHLLAARLDFMEKRMWSGDRTEWVKSGCSSLMAMKFIDMNSNSLCLCSAYRKLYCSLLDINLIYLSFLHCPHSSCPWAFLFILLLDGLVMQPPG